MELIDTHCHVQSAGTPGEGERTTRELWGKAGGLTPTQIIENACHAGVKKMICVGCDLDDSRLAVDFVQNHPECWASIGIHPHEAQHYVGQSEKLQKFASLTNEPKVVAIGECGLDYYYNHSSKKDQIEILRFQIELALECNVPMIFHVRDAFDDFWPIFDSFTGIRGVIHSFSADGAVLENILKRGLFVGLNGIMTFTKHEEQLEAARAVPLDRLLVETDAPFLTPTPYRGTICEPKHARTTAEFLAELRGESVTALAHATSGNARKLFGI